MSKKPKPKTNWIYRLGFAFGLVVAANALAIIIFAGINLMTAVTPEETTFGLQLLTLGVIIFAGAATTAGLALQAVLNELRKR